MTNMKRRRSRSRSRSRSRNRSRSKSANKSNGRLRDNRLMEVDSVEMGQVSPTENLVKWITNVHHKKQKCHSSPKRNFQMVAVLTHTLNKATYELRSKQLVRLARWQRLKKDFLKGVTYGSCQMYHLTEAERERQQRLTQHYKGYEKEMCEELSGLDNFLQQVSSIKTHVQR